MPMRDRLDPAAYRDVVRRALAEDVGAGDVTTRAVVPNDVQARAVIEAKRVAVLAGLDIARETFAQVDPSIVFEPLRQDGELCEAGDMLATLRGRAGSLLTAERTALNFLQHLSGIATLTRRFVEAAAGRLVVLDTRKTLPTLRQLEKYAVRCGGGVNHRTGLFDAVLIKDNHIRLAGGVEEAVRRARAAGIAGPIEVEAQDLNEVDAAIASGAETIMLDNLDEALMREAITRIGGRARVEVSGGVTLERMPLLAELGADCISVGALTHSAPAADIGMELEKE
jgi:nicotinate-nucleotide pyrophosphorylase (carboxylating)